MLLDYYHEMLKFIILLIFVTSITIPIQSVDGLSCAEGYMPDPNYKYDPDTFSMQSCVTNPDYVNPYEKTITDLIGIEPTTTTSETTSEPTINISFSVDTLPILLIIIFIIIVFS